MMKEKIKIIDENGAEIHAPDLAAGSLYPDRILLRRHPAVAAVQEQGHYEVEREYPETGGRDLRWVIDVPGVDAKAAYDEYEDVLRYIPHGKE